MTFHFDRHSDHSEEADRCCRIAQRINTIRGRLNDEWGPLLDRNPLWPLFRSGAERRNRTRFHALGRAFDANNVPWQNHIDAMGQLGRDGAAANAAHLAELWQQAASMQPQWPGEPS